jgi:hypothetical protein
VEAWQVQKMKKDICPNPSFAIFFLNICNVQNTSTFLGNFARQMKVLKA